VRKKTFITEIIPDVDDRCDEALALIEKGDIARGQAVLEDLRRQHPDYHTVLYGIGVCHGMKGQMDEAISCLERAVEIFPPFAHAHYNLGSSYSKKADIENAVKAYEAAIVIDGSEGEVGRLACERLDELEAIVEKGGVNLSTYIRNGRIFDRGFLALQEGRFQAAIDLFAQVLATQKDHVQSYGNMGLAYAILGNRQKALECLDKAIELDPEYEPAIVNRLSVASLKDGEALPSFDPRELNYYSEFKLRGKSYVQHLVDELKAGGK
jgi:tetratricopeptide (TPR) repeat protein